LKNGHPISQTPNINLASLRNDLSARRRVILFNGLGEKIMKFTQYFASFIVVAFALSLSALAKDSNSGSFTLADTVQVGSTQLAAGGLQGGMERPCKCRKDQYPAAR
jgi:hypothetical protein